jgi:hypothetical protein|tara:strand:+ start:267 stop:428 length:162 start_codon:yes stop_codon:yes gene_type:complete
MKGNERRQSIAKRTNQIEERIPHPALPNSVHPIIYKLLGNNEDQIINNTSYES